MKIKKMISDTAKYWYIFLAVFVLFEVLNYGVLSMFVTPTVCFWVSSALIILLFAWGCLIACDVYDRISRYFQEKHTDLNEKIEELKTHINELDEKNSSLARKLADALTDTVEATARESVNKLEREISEAEDAINDEIRSNSSELKSEISENSEKLLEESEKIFEAQNKNKNEIIDVQKKTSTSLESSIKDKIGEIANHEENLINSVANELKQQNEEKTEKILVEIAESTSAMKQQNVEKTDKMLEMLEKSALKTDETICGVNEAIRNSADKNHSELVEIIGNTERKLVSDTESVCVHLNNKMEEQFSICNGKASENASRILQSIEHYRDASEKLITSVAEQNNREHIESMQKAEEILEINKKQCDAHNIFVSKNEKCFEELSENHKKQLCDVKESVCMTVVMASENEIDRINSSEESLKAVAEMHNKTQSSLINSIGQKADALEKVIEGELSSVKNSVSAAVIQSSAEEIKAVKEAQSRILAASEQYSNTQIGKVQSLGASLEEKIGAMITSESGALENSIVRKTAEIMTRFVEFKAMFDAENARHETKAMELQKETNKLIGLLSESLGQYEQKNNDNINALNDILIEDAKNTAANIESLLEEIDLIKNQFGDFVSAMDDYSVIQEAKIEESTNSIIDCVTGISDYYDEYCVKINKMGAELSNMSRMTKMLENMYSLLQEKAKYGGGEAKTPREEIKNADRVEEYKDDESGAIVRNHYKHNKLVLGEMIVSGKKTYEIEYNDTGKITKSRNYNAAGEVVSELEFYPNGQVKARKETFEQGGKKEVVISLFDDKGNKRS